MARHRPVRARWLVAALALGTASAAGLQAGDIKPDPGTVITNTVFATITANGANFGYMDTEDRFALEAATPDELVYRIHVSAPGNRKLDETAAKLHWFRHVAHADLEQSSRMTLLYSSNDPESYGGQTFAETSRKVLATLKSGTDVPFVFGPYAGVGGDAGGAAATAAKAAAASGGAPAVADAGKLFNMLLGSARHYYRGTLHRVEATDVPVSVLVNGKRVDLPAVHAAGTFTFGQDTPEKAEVWWLDNPDWPLTLHWVFGPASDLVTRIDFHAPAGGGHGSGAGHGAGGLNGTPHDADDIAGELAGKNCHVELHGIYFDSGSAVLLPESEPMLQQVAEAVKASPAGVLTIEGHTDNIGSADYNQKLSEARAGAVRDALVNRYGIAATRLTSRGYGLTKPVETNATPQGRARNRRVELSRPCPGH